jgi:hypothetical protein
LLSSITRFSAAGYAAPSVGGSDETVASYNSAISALISQAQMDGLNVAEVDMNSVINPVTDLQDGVHPITARQPAMSAAFLAAINGTTPAPIASIDGFYNWQRW